MIFWLLMAIVGPAPDAGNCWLAWQDRIGAYEVWSGETRCAVLPGFEKPNGRWVNPRKVYWPRPGDGCWRPGQSAQYKVRACTDGQCGAFDVEVEFGPQPFLCFDSRGQIPCL